MKGLYIHIPFCKSICSYCDFPKQIAKKEEQHKYITYLIKEIDSYKKDLTDVDTIYIGGGTPNLLDLSLFKKLLLHIEPYLNQSIETTIELNPELITEDFVKLLKEFHIKRVSLGVQTIDPSSLFLLRRCHKKEEVKESIVLLKKYGIENINVDLIFGIPNTSLKQIKEDLDFITSLPITHISYYSLILEDKTILKSLIQKKEVKELEDDTIADMYEWICGKLEELGYEHYEISNFAKKGYESKHNLLYWNCEEYIGVGAGACGYLHHKRYQNHRILHKYYDHPIENIENIDVYEEKKEFFLLGFRLIKGVNLKDYVKKFSSDPFKDFNLKKLISQNLIEIKEDYAFITKNKLFVANLVFEEFVGD